MRKYVGPRFPWAEKSTPFCNLLGAVIEIKKLNKQKTKQKQQQKRKDVTAMFLLRDPAGFTRFIFYKKESMYFISFHG